jgi:hypothetical protein
MKLIELIPGHPPVGDGNGTDAEEITTEFKYTEVRPWSEHDGIKGRIAFIGGNPFSNNSTGLAIVLDPADISCLFAAAIDVGVISMGYKKEGEEK